MAWECDLGIEGETHFDLPTVSIISKNHVVSYRGQAPCLNYSIQWDTSKSRPAKTNYIRIVSQLLFKTTNRNIIFSSQIRNIWWAKSESRNRASRVSRNKLDLHICFSKQVCAFRSKSCTCNHNTTILMRLHFMSSRISRSRGREIRGKQNTRSVIELELKQLPSRHNMIKSPTGIEEIVEGCTLTSPYQAAEHYHRKNKPVHKTPSFPTRRGFSNFKFELVRSWHMHA